MKNKSLRTPVLLLIVGAVLVLIGILFEVMQWKLDFFNERILVLIGGLLELIGGAWLLYKLMQLKNKKD